MCFEQEICLYNLLLWEVKIVSGPLAKPSLGGMVGRKPKSLEFISFTQGKAISLLDDAITLADHYWSLTRNE